MTQAVERRQGTGGGARRLLAGHGRVLVAGCLVALSGCASGPSYITDGREERVRDAAQAQSTADAIRRDGGSAAARSAQDRADRLDAEARRRPSGALEWLVDVLFESWLASGTQPGSRSR